jgi:hypothetical protein
MALSQSNNDKGSGAMIPFVTLCYVLSYINRIDVNLAFPAMSKTLGLPVSSFGAGFVAFSFMHGYYPGSAG